MKRSALAASAGSTLLETMIAASIAGAILGAIVLGGFSLQRTYLVANDYFRASADEMLVSDSMARDLRSALGVTVSTPDPQVPLVQTLTLTVPDYIDPSTGNPRTPTLNPGTPKYGSAVGKVDYGSVASPLTVTYSVSGQRLIRQSGNTQSVLSSSVQNFQLTGVDQGTSAEMGVTFASKFARQKNVDTRTGTTVRSTLSMRNPQRY
ncbi:MAG: hypothetical protein QOE70_5635 [Chthoniobacter sp.]|jgi:Tfp pilus assembly protein PilW|nr:hypothetical protein [Chthoniobacter sp.]